MLFGYRSRLDRRTFLRAGAVSVALPLLDSMLPAGRAAESVATKAKRLVVLQRPLGTYAPYFFPETPGPQYEATRFLKLIDAHRGQFTVFSGMSHLGYPNDHRTEFALLSGVHPDMIKRMDDMHNTISLDQEAAEAVGRQTRVPYLLLGPMHDGLSSSHKGVSLPGNTRRSEVFAQLFVNGTPDEVAREVRRLQDGKSILDGVRDQLRRLESESGAVDRRRMDVLATSIREAERSLTQDEEWATQPKPNVGAKPDSDANEWVGHTRQWFDLIHLAVQTDSTRVIVHRIPEQPAAPTAPGTQIGEHDASHHGKEPGKIAQVAAFEDAHFKLLDHLLKKLRDSAEGDGTLLDNTQVLFLSNMGDGSAHASNNLPVLLAGGGYKHPGHVVFDRPSEKLSAVESLPPHVAANGDREGVIWLQHRHAHRTGLMSSHGKKMNRKSRQVHASFELSHRTHRNMKPTVLRLAALSLLLAPLAALQAGDDGPIVGAIRWDGWYGDATVTKAVEASLGQPKYHFRLPWFAQLQSDGSVRINGDSQAIMEQEIAYAAVAGLNYWAVVDYWDEAPGMSIALNRYLAAKDKRGIRYCLVEEGHRLDKIGSAGWKRLVEHFQRPDYQTVLDGRPLLFVFVKPTQFGRPEWDDLRRQTLAAGLKTPYLVLMGYRPEQDAKDMTAIGFDAVSAYARGGSYSLTQPTYAEQCVLIRRERWEKWQALRVPSITFASAGWDTRPRNERPPPWLKDEFKAEPDPTPPAQQKPLLDAVTATPDELAAHVCEAVQWAGTHRDLNPANAIIIYAWNEHDEGGWLQPTRGADGRPNDERIKSLAKTLRPTPLKTEPLKP